MSRAARRIRWALGAAVLLGALFLATLTFFLIYPEPLFQHRLREGRITLHSDTPIPEVMRVHLAEVEARLDRSPIAEKDRALDLFVANTAWRRNFLWLAASPSAVGWVMIPTTGNHAFISRTDFEKGLINLPGWGELDPPRTFAYYGAHELAHAQTAKRLGPIAFHRLPKWIREGFADYVGIAPREDFAALLAAIGPEPAAPEHRYRYGYYPDYRLLVTYFLEIRGWSAEELFKSGMSEDEAREELRGAGMSP